MSLWIHVILPALYILYLTPWIHPISGQVVHTEKEKSYGIYDPDYIETVIDYETTDEKTKPVVCYTCHYSKTVEHDQGMKNCDEPFKETGIPTILCEGSCAITNTSASDKDYMIVRSCLPNCKDIIDDASTVTCCAGDKCNGRRERRRRVDMVTVVGTGSMFVAMALICVVLCTRK